MPSWRHRDAGWKEEGIDVRVDSKVIGVEKQGNSIAVKVDSERKISQIVGTHVLIAIGRRPNTDDLGLDKAGIATDAHGYIQVDDQLRTT
jgi:pyruvate/2-oxoglutarate dehydrogenase complex dihydrolipoamide dehydrogenase (E3) component